MLSTGIITKPKLRDISWQKSVLAFWLNPKIKKHVNSWQKWILAILHINPWHVLKSTKKCKKVPRSTKKYQEVPKSTKKFSRSQERCWNWKKISKKMSRTFHQGKKCQHLTCQEPWHFCQQLTCQETFHVNTWHVNSWHVKNFLLIMMCLILALQWVLQWALQLTLQLLGINSNAQKTF